MAWMLEGQPGAKADAVPAGTSPISTGSIVPSAPAAAEPNDK
jgi:hypothetical protein